jgi:hypothetical protein
MAKGQVVTDEVKALITKVYLEHPHYRAKEVRAKVHAELLEENPRISPEWPGLSIVQKTIAPIRALPADPEGSPWSLYTLSGYDIAADALPVVLEAYGQTVKWDLEKPLTVREAKWVARLYRVLTHIEELVIAARECASNERIGEITGKPSPSLVDGDFISRAVTGKPGITYKYLGRGELQMIVHPSDLWEIDIDREQTA